MRIKFVMVCACARDLEQCLNVICASPTVNTVTQGNLTGVHDTVFLCQVVTMDSNCSSKFKVSEPHQSSELW